MPRKSKRSKATKGQPEVWVSSDLMVKMKGPGGSRGTHVPQSPYLLLADRFLGLAPEEGPSGKAQSRAATGHPGHKAKGAAAPAEPPPRVLAAAAGAGPEGVLSTSMPRMVYPRPPQRPAPPKPPKVVLSRPPARPNVPKLQPPKPPKLSFGYRRRKATE